MNATTKFAAVLILSGAGLSMGQYPPARTGYQAASPLVVPAYALGIKEDPPTTPAPRQQGEPPWVKRLEDKLDKLLRMVEDEATGADPKVAAAPQPGQNAKELLEEVLGGCAACHAPDSKKDGGNKVFFEAKAGGLDFVLPTTEEAWNKQVRKVRLNQMPPPENNKHVAPLTPAQKSAILDLLEKNRPAR